MGDCVGNLLKRIDLLSYCVIESVGLPEFKVNN